jgi:hypothetical protein
MTNHTPDPIEPLPTELARRLAALGTEPVDPAVASAHLTAIAAAQPRRALRPVRGRFVRGKVAAAFAAGLVLGGTSLASAGVLGNTPQNAVADAAGHVGLDLPGGTPRSTEGCGGKTYRNHGQFVSQGGDPHSPCGKPVKSKDKPGKADDAKDTKDAKNAPGAGNGCGKPPWAGKGNHAKKTPEAVAQRTAACGDDESDTTNEAPKAGAGAPTTAAAPTTTVSETTTTAVTTTTEPATTTTGVTSTTEPVTTTTAP